MARQQHWFRDLRPAAVWGMVKRTVKEWSDDKAPRLGAALAYYTVFSLVPLLVIIIAMIGLFLGQEAAQSYILDQIGSMVGQQSAAAIKDMLQRASQPASGLLATVVAGATLLFGASGLFGQLQDALNTIWGVEPKPDRGLWGMIQDRFLSFMAVLGTAFLLLVSLVISAALAAFGKWFGGILPAPEVVLQVINFAVSVAVITMLFAMIFKLLPDARIAWRDVWIGAAMTALLFTIGKFLIGLYLGKSDVGSAYGAAGSLVIVLLWVYYSSQILLFGAEFTQVYANTSGEKIIPTEQAVVVDQSKAGGSLAPSTSPSSLAPGARVQVNTPEPIHSSRRVDRQAAFHRWKEGVPVRAGGQWDHWLGAAVLAWSLWEWLRSAPGGRVERDRSRDRLTASGRSG
ncbi:MAG TPA: YihY/virulence factor BrkB family protein [Nitrospiraceae bacterium]|nr:YihY/virulence factor BrkB family protein [Nitrospiraceae bacterium]